MIMRHSIKVFLVYCLMCYIILIPLKMWVISISVSILVGFLFGLLNDIWGELRKLNEKQNRLNEHDED